MDTLAAVSLVVSIASENSNVEILKALLGYNREDVVATQLKSDGSLWKFKFGSQSLILNKVSDASTSQEYESLLVHHQLSPGFAPQPYHYDAQRHAVLEEDLSDFAQLSQEIAASKVDVTAIKKFGTLLGQLHKLTHSASNSAIVRDLQKKFRSNSVVEQTVQSVFVDTFDQQHLEGIQNEVVKTELAKLSSNKSLMDKVASLKNAVLHRKECLSHGLLSTAAVGVKNGEVKLLSGFDGTFLGPCAFDLAALVADYIEFYHRHMLTEVDNDAHRQVSYKMVDACTQTIDAYLEEMTVSVDGRDKYVQRLVSDVAGICGVLLISRVGKRTHNDREALSKGVETLQSGIRLLGAADRIHTSSLLVNIALMLTF